MKKLFPILVILLGCNIENKENTDPISFEISQKNESEKIIAAYTDDPDSLWTNEEWVESLKNEMKNLSSNYSTILLFDSENNIPDVATQGMNYSSDYDVYMVGGYWVYPNGNVQFCYGGRDKDGNFKKCE